MRLRKITIICLLCLCPLLVSAKDVRITLLQANDVYELAPVNGGRYGGLARVQTIFKQLKANNKNTYAILAGDLISPSAIGTAKVDGSRLNGKQMVDVLNLMGWDYLTLGNHEFDNGRDALIERLREAKFKTVSSNVLDATTAAPFGNTLTYDTFTVDGVKIGIGGITLPSLANDFVDIKDPFTSAQAIIRELKDNQNVDILLLITHQDFTEDITFATNLTEVDLILGGHEHENIYLRRGLNFVPIAKADSNARSVYIHELTYNTDSKTLAIESRLQIISAAIKEDATVKKRVDNWLQKAFAAWRTEGIEPEQQVAVTTDTLDGMEASVRNGSTKLTELVARAALNAFADCELSILNAGSIRIDDVLPPGAVTEYDIVRVHPFGGSYQKVLIPGDILLKTFAAGLANRGKGGYLHHANVSQQENRWYINNEVVETNRNYTVAIGDFLIDRGDVGLEFLVNNPRIERAPATPIDSRLALIAEFKRTYPPVADAAGF